jgi:hypothetical protein
MNPTPTAARDFPAYAWALASAPDDALAAYTSLKHAFAGRFPRVETVLKAAVEAGNTTDPAAFGALSDYGNMITAWLATGRASAFDRIATLSRSGRVGYGYAATIAVPTAALVEESGWKALTHVEFGKDALPRRKGAALVALTEEALRMFPAGALDLIDRELRAAVRTVTDTELFAILTAPSATPSGVSTGDLLADLSAATADIDVTGESRLVYVLPPAVLAQAALKRTADGAACYPGLTTSGGTLNGVTILPSDSTGGDGILVDADGLVLASESLGLRSSRNGTLVFDSEPGTGPQTAVSLFQTNSVALLVERWFSAAIVPGRTPVAVVDSPDYTAQAS